MADVRGAARAPDRPETEAELARRIGDAHADGRPLTLAANGTKRTLGKPGPGGHPVDLRAFAGIDLYEPEELVLSAGAATPLAEIEAALADQGQALAFEPPDLGPLLGAEAGRGTVGGAIACALAGPRRIAAGGVRDHLLGARVVTGKGEVLRAGSRVVKNVTGYDLPKLLCGSHGTLAAMTRVTLKVLPAAEATRTVVLRGLDTAAGVRALTAGLQAPYAVSGAAYQPRETVVDAAAPLPDGQSSLTLLRVEGPPASAAHRAEKLAGDVLADHGRAAVLDDAASRDLWARVRDVKELAGEPHTAVWRVAVPPAAAPPVVERLCAAAPGTARWFLDWGGGRIWFAVPAGTDAKHGAIRAALPRRDGSAMLVAAPESVRAAVPVFQPQDAGKAVLTRKLKAAFDPAGILNPGRMDGAD